ncbi:MAG TPA: hypothetical protein VN894_01130 [Polyangiaceae bacterium]|nr:hypothetical protein [Polyangiaceae bacterium]
MRAALVVVAVAGLAHAALSCRPGAAAVEEDANVYVPAGDDAGVDAGAEAGADGATFALGQIDRAGRPLVTVLLVPASLKDAYNAASTFDAPPSRTIQDGLASRLEAFDMLELGDSGPDPVDWTIDGGAHPLVPMLATDALLVDTALSCAAPDGGFAATYLDIERDIFPDIFGSNAVHTTCGGRTPSDHVVDTTLTLLVTRDRLGAPLVAQGIAGPARPPATSFPYLAPPYAN